MNHPASHRIGHYELGGLLGEGAVGQVYAAHDVLLDRQVAIKRLKPELTLNRALLARFHVEARSLARLTHPNITMLYDFQVDGPEAVMVMEWVRGHTLDAVLSRVGALPLRESRAILAQAIAGLEYAHRLGVFHRDVKPSNLMITDAGLLKITDFGLARIQGSPQITQVGEFHGTLAYASPEQINADPTDQRSDLYSLAIVFYKMLVGAAPFTDDSDYALMTAHLLQPPPPLAGRVPLLDAGTEAALMRALAKRPEERFSSVVEFGDAVGATALRRESEDIIRELYTAMFDNVIDATRIIPATRSASTDRIFDIGQSIARLDQSAASAEPASDQRNGSPSFNGIGVEASRSDPPAVHPSRIPAFTLAIGFLTLLVAGSGFWFLTSHSGEPARPATAPRERPNASLTQPLPLAESPLIGELAARFGSAAPKIPDKRREERAREYVAARAHKAQAVAPNVGGTWRATGRPSAENAQTASLEQCQIFYGEPCVLVAVNDLMQPVPVDGNWIRHDMQRPRYADVFDPEQIPGAGPGLRNRSDIVNYRTAPAPKAAAYHPSGGRLFTVSGAASQRSAEEDVLKACNIDPSREGKDGSCFLYAVGDQVVLPRRVKDAVTSTAPLRDLLAMRLASAAPGRPSKVREDVSKEYETARQHKAQAAAPPDVVWHTAGRPTAANAEESALESCQVVSGTPCALIALDDALQPMPVDGNWPRRDMPRARYAGSFDPAQLPGTWPSVRERADVLGYRQAAGPKAAAFHPAGGRVFIVTGAADQRAAEEAALQACGADRLPFPVGGSCFLYAAGDQVVLPQRLKAPMAKER